MDTRLPSYGFGGMGPSMEFLTMQGSPEEGPREGASSGDSPPRAREVLLGASLSIETIK